MPQPNVKELLAAEKRKFFYILVLCVAVGLICIFGAVWWKHSLLENRLVVFETGQTIGQIEGVGSVTVPLAEQVKKLLGGESEVKVLLVDGLRDVGIAFFLAAVVTLLIDWYSSTRLRQEIAHDVVSAAYTKLIPKEIYTQVADKVFRSDVCRRDWRVVITAQPQSINGTAVITATYSYDVENLNEHEIPFEVNAGIDLDDPPPHGDMPKFEIIQCS